RTVHGNMDVAYQSTGTAAAFARTGVTGHGVTVAVLDSGIALSAELPAERILAAIDLVDAVSAPAPRDLYGHGTHIAGIIGASGNSAVPGLAPGVKFVSVRVLDENGAGSVSRVIRGI